MSSLALMLSSDLIALLGDSIFVGGSLFVVILIVVLLVLIFRR